MTPDPKLVEALAELVSAWSQQCPLSDAETDVANAIRHDCGRFFDTHRLVQLPEEPDAWIDGENRRRMNAGQNTVFVTRVKPWVADDEPDDFRPIYIIPGDPQEVDEKEYRARVYGEFPPEEAPDA